MYTLFLRDPYRTLVFHVPPEMHVDQVCNIEYKLYDWYILCHEKSLPFTGGS